MIKIIFFSFENIVTADAPANIPTNLSVAPLFLLLLVPDMPDIDDIAVAGRTDDSG